MRKRPGTDCICLHGLGGCLLMRIRTQDKSRALPPHSVIVLTCQRGSGAGSGGGSGRLVRFRQRSVQPRCYLTSVIAGKVSGLFASSSFVYKVTPVVAGALAGALRVQRRQASGS